MKGVAGAWLPPWVQMACKHQEKEQPPAVAKGVLDILYIERAILGYGAEIFQ